MSILRVRIAVINPTIADDRWKRLIALWATESDRAAAARYGAPAGAKRTLLGRALLRGLVDDLVAGDARRCPILAGDGGKPYLHLPSGEPGPAVSISHSGDLIAAAATNLGPLGIDVERHRADRSFDRIAAFAFGERERRLASVSPRAFYRLWTLREAMSKATGRGLAEAADGVDRVPEHPATGAWRQEHETGLWFLAHLEPVPGYSLAVAVMPREAAGCPPWSPESIEWWRTAAGGAPGP